MSAHVSLLLFDLDETIAPDEANDRALFAEIAADIARERSLPARSLVAAIDAAANRLWSAAPTADYCQRIGIHAWEGLWGPFSPSADPMLAHLHAFAPGYRIAAWNAALTACGIHDPDAAASLAERFLTARRERQAAYPWARAALDALRADHHLGMITNGAPDLQRLKLDGTGLAEYFDPVVVSGDLGVGKPEPAIFAHALEQAGSSAAEAVMIGDSWQRDIQGALGAGLRAVWINPRGAAAPTAGTGAFIIPDLRALPEVVARYASE